MIPPVMHGCHGERCAARDVQESAGVELHADPRRHQPARDRLGTGRPGRDDRGEAARRPGPRFSWRPRSRRAITGFFFPITKLTPGLVIGARSSLVVLAAAIYARYARHLAGVWPAGPMSSPRWSPCISTCLLADRPVLPEGGRPPGAGPDTGRTAVRDRAGRHARHLHRPRIPRDKAVPRAAPRSSLDRTTTSSGFRSL